MKLLVLKRTIPKERLPDIERMQKLLLKNGYECPAADIEAAYAGWCKSIPNKPEWHPLSFLNDEKIMKALLSQLEPRAEGPEQSTETPKESESNVQTHDSETPAP